MSPDGATPTALLTKPSAFHTAGDHATKAAGAGHSPSISSSPDASISATRCSVFRAAFSSACFRIFLFRRRRAIASATIFSSSSTFFRYSALVLSSEAHVMLAHVFPDRMHSEQRGLFQFGMATQSLPEAAQRSQGTSTISPFSWTSNAERSRLEVRRDILCHFKWQTPPLCVSRSLGKREDALPEGGRIVLRTRRARPVRAQGCSHAVSGTRAHACSRQSTARRATAYGSTVDTATQDAYGRQSTARPATASRHSRQRHRRLS